MKKNGLYFGKTQIYNYLKIKHKLDLPLLKNCTYKKYRGSEWLQFPFSESDIFYSCYFCGKYYSIEKIHFDFDSGEKTLIERKVFSY